MASFSIAQRSYYYTFKCRHLLLSPTPSQRLSNQALNLQLSYVLYFVYCDGCHILGYCDDAEGLGTPMISWGIWEFHMSSFDRPGGAPTCLQLRTTDILIDRNWLLQFFAAQENHTTAGLAGQ